MKFNWKRLGVITAVLALVGLFVFNAVAFAQGPVNDPAGREGHPGPGFGLRIMGRWGGFANSPVAVAADILGMDRVDLVAELREGKSIAEIAGDQLEEIVDALLAKRQAILNQLVEEGQITQEQADAILESMESHLTERLSQPFAPRGFGRGLGDGQGKGPRFIDADGDGVCDHFVDEDGDGVNDLRGTFHMGRGRMGGRW
ncbi:MAG TPA: DUF2680 domain-containing protein [Caldilineae bacterium]|jgi:hypothetical protein|nr:DUF2680 domain-containing protein [Caldilineae bacterium]